MSSAIARAFAKVGVRERPGEKNREAQIDMWNRYAGNALGSPYCAAFVSYMLEAAKTPFPNTGSSQAIRRWAEEQGRFSADPNDLLNWKGALFGWTNPDKAHGHVGFVRSRWTDHDGDVVAIQTVEANTSPAGSRDGDGVYSLRRSVPVDGKHRLWFVRLDGLPGGEWW